MKKRPDLLIEIILLILVTITGFYAFKNNIPIKNIKGIKIPEVYSTP